MREPIATLTVPDPTIAARFVLACGQASQALNDALYDVKPHVVEDEFRALAHAVGTVLGHEIFDLRERLVEQHPQLDTPDLKTLLRRYEGGR